jgi:hypothetical protein
MASGTTTDRFDEIVSTTLRNYRPKLVDNVTEKISLFKWLKEKGRMRVESGGEEIIVPILYAFNDTVGSYSGYDQIDLVPQTGIGNARYEWKQAAGSVTISGKEMRQNSGEHQIINLLKGKTQQLELSFANWFNEKLFADGSGNDSKDIDGLGLFVTTDGTGTVGGINASTYTWWKNYYDAGTQSAAAFDNLLSDMRACYNTISKGVDFPDIAITDQDTFQGYESLLLADINYNIGMVDTKAGDLGFKNLMFKGCMLTWDADCGDDMYMLNSNYLELVTHKDANFELQPFIKPDNQDAKSALMLWQGNLTCSNRSKQGIIYTIT